MRILDDIPCEIDPDEIFEALHLKAQHPYANELRTLIDKASELAHPRAVYQVAFVEQRGADSVVIADAPQELDQPTGQQTGCHQAASGGSPEEFSSIGSHCRPSLNRAMNNARIAPSS